MFKIVISHSLLSWNKKALQKGMGISPARDLLFIQMLFKLIHRDIKPRGYLIDG